MDQNNAGKQSRFDEKVYGNFGLLLSGKGENLLLTKELKYFRISFTSDSKRYVILTGRLVWRG